MAGRRVRSNKYANAGITAAGTAARHTAKVTHQLFLEVAGLFFGVLTFVVGSSAVRHHRAYVAGAEPREKYIFAVASAALFAYFAVTSFMRARKVR